MLCITPSAPRIKAEEAKRLILAGKAPDGLHVDGALHLDCRERRELRLPANLKVRTLNLSGNAGLKELPLGLHVRHLILQGCTGLTHLPRGLHCYELDLRGTALTSLPADLRVEYKLNLQDCNNLQALPAGLTVGTLILRGCTALTALPRGLEVCFLDLQDCVQLHDWPDQARVQMGRLNVAGCIRLRALPRTLQNLSQLNVSGCTNLRELPAGLRVSSWIDLAHSGITALPESLRGVRLCWRGVLINERIAFHPETITVEEILHEPNAEVRRVLLERVGFEWFVLRAGAEVLDTDHDAGGERRLLRISLAGDEDLVCVAVFCPSTGRQYVLRVPPHMRTCRQAVAWTAGFDNADLYQPLAET